jgi:hypothetical protein
MFRLEIVENHEKICAHLLAAEANNLHKIYDLDGICNLQFAIVTLDGCQQICLISILSIQLMQNFPIFLFAEFHVKKFGQAHQLHRDSSRPELCRPRTLRGD